MNLFFSGHGVLERRERDGAFAHYPTVVGTSHHCELVVAFC